MKNNIAFGKTDSADLQSVPTKFFYNINIFIYKLLLKLTKMKKIYYGCVLLLLQLVISCKENDKTDKFDVNNQKVEFSESDIKKMIKEFYTAYITQSLDTISPNKNIEKLDSISQIYCTKSLLDSIKNEFENNELDYDPIINGQDTHPEMLKTMMINKNQKVNKYKVMFLSNTYDSSFEEVNLSIVKEGNKYKISSLN